MTIFHIGKRGVPVQCKAKPGNCPLKNQDGEPSPHFETKEKMNNFIDYSNQLIHENYFPKKLNTDNLSSQEIKEYIKFNNHFIENQRKMLDESYKFIENKRLNLGKKFESQLSEDELEILKQTNIAYEKGFLDKNGYVVYENSPVPLACLENVEGPVKVVAQHALVQKFGPFKGLPVFVNSFSKKNLEWISDYKNNPELLEKDYNTIKNNMLSFNKLYDKKGKLIKNSIDENKIKYIYNNVDNKAISENNIRKSELEELQKTNMILEEEYQLHEYLENKIKSAKINNRKETKDLPFTKSYPVDSKNISEPFRISNLYKDKKGNIENLFLYNKENKQIEKITEVKDDTSNNLISETGKVFNLETRYARRTHGRWATGQDKSSPYELIVTTPSPSKKSIPYDGENTIHHTYIISTD